MNQLSVLEIFRKFEEDILRLSFQFEMMVTAFRQNDQREFGRQGRKYLDSLMAYHHDINITLYSPVRNFLNGTKRANKFNQFETQTIKRQINLQHFFDIYLKTPVQDIDECHRGAYRMDEKVQEQHSDERSYLYPLYTELMDSLPAEDRMIDTHSEDSDDPDWLILNS